MNTGIGDAVNLAWKLAAVLQGRAPRRLLDSYEAERIAFARRLVATTDRVFTFATAEGAIADLMRTRVAPLLMPRAVALEPVREFLFRTVSQITVNYRGSPLSAGAAGRVHGGDRLPWALAGGSDNYTALTAISWQVHVYGTAREALTLWCQEHGAAAARVPLRARARGGRPDARCALSAAARHLPRPGRGFPGSGRARTLCQRTSTAPGRAGCMSARARVGARRPDGSASADGVCALRNREKNEQCALVGSVACD